MRFDELIFPVEPARFFAEIYDRRPFHSSPGDRSRPNLMNWRQFNMLLSQSALWSHQNLKLVSHGKPIPAELYCEEVNTSKGKALRPKAGLVNLYASSGASLIANELQTLIPEVELLSQNLAKTFSADVGANAYCSFESVKAFEVHYDIHDVFVLQCEGEKTWRLYERHPDNPDGFPTGSHEDVQDWFANNCGKLTQELTLKKGDVLYLPRGWFHEALARNEPSLHLTFSVTPLTARSIFPLLEAAAMQSPAFRAWLPSHHDEAALRQRLRELMDYLVRLSQSPAFLDELVMSQQRQVRRAAEYDLPNRGHLVTYSWTGVGRIAVRGPAGVAAEWAMAQPQFTREELVARFDFIPEDQLIAWINSSEQAGSLRRG